MLSSRPGGGAVADFFGRSFEGTAGRDCPDLANVFDDEVEDSRTGRSRAESVVSPGLLDAADLLRVGLGCLERGVLVVAGTNTLEEYEDAELGVGTWLNGESVYLVEGVAEGA